MMNDRNYFRMLEDEDLISLASRAESELALVLAGRLEEANGAIEALNKIISKGDDE